MHLLDLGRPDRPDVSRPPVPLTAGRDAAYRVIGKAGHELLLFTDHGAPRRRLVAMDPRQPDPARWRDVIPEDPDVIDSIREINGRFVVVYLRDVQHRISVFARDGADRPEVALPAMTTVLSIEAGPTRGEIVTEPYSPVHRVKAGTCYPATLVTTALNDDRAPAWQAMKFTAALQAAQSCDRPILLRAATTGGHGGSDFVEEAADALAFAAQQFGMMTPVAGGT